jgi:uncharacterized protein YfiM (DUF2279 family)
MNSASIIIGPGYATWDSGNFRFGEGGLKAKFVKKYREVSAEEFGRFDSTQTGRMIQVTGRLWSGYENLSLVIPSAATSPTIGGKLFGTSGLNLVINGQDGSRLTVVNAQLTGMANMTLSVGKELWSGDVTFTGLLKPGNTPDQAGSYYAYSISNSYSAPSFTKTNFRAPIISAAWAGTLTNSGTSFSAFNFKNGCGIDWKWDIDYEPCDVDGFGIVDGIVNGFEASAKGTPIGVIEADAAAALLPAQALGVLESVNGGDLTLTFGANSVTLKQAFVSQNEGFAWSRKNNRIGDLTWRTTVPFTTGAPTARAALA